MARLVALRTWAAGDGKAEAAAGAMRGTDVEIDDYVETVTLGSGDKAMTISGGDSAQLPAGFPEDVLLPADYKVDSTLASGDFTMVTMRAPGEVAALADQARIGMESAGWEQQMKIGRAHV